MTITTGTPLVGTRVLVTRARRQAGSFSDALAALGAEVIELPGIEIVPAAEGPLDTALAGVQEYDWLVLTSVNAVDAVVARLRARGLGAGHLRGVRVAAIGPATARRLGRAGIPVDFMPAEYVAEAVVEGLVASGVGGARVLLPRADIARDTLPAGLRAAGAQVDVVVAYHTLPPNHVDPVVVDLLRRGEVDILTFASPSTVRNVADYLGDARPAACVVCIGPITAAAAEECGFAVAAVASEYSIAGLIDAVVRTAKSHGSRGAMDVT